MKVSPTSSSLTTRVLIVVLVSIVCIFGFSLRTMGPENEVFPSGWFTNAIVGEGMVEAKPMKRYISLIEEMVLGILKPFTNICLMMINKYDI